MMTEMDWNYRWATYEGQVRVILDDNSVAFGTAIGYHHTEADNPMMHVQLDGAKIWIHPRYVWPKGEYE